MLQFCIEIKQFIQPDKTRGMETKYIIITGGVASSLGKGIISASLENFAMPVFGASVRLRGGRIFFALASESRKNSNRAQLGQ